MFSGCSPFLLALLLNASVHTQVFNECYMSHRRLTRIFVLLCQVARASFIHLESCSLLAVAIDSGSGRSSNRAQTPRFIIVVG